MYYQNKNDFQNFQNDLYNNLIKAGIIDELKVYLHKEKDVYEKKYLEHQKYLEELQKVPVAEQKKQNDLLVKCILVDYLATYNLNFSYSVVVPEIKLKSDQIIQTDQILTQLKLSKEMYSEQVNRILEFDPKQFKLQPKLSALDYIVYSFLQRNQKNYKNADIQTEKLQEIDLNQQQNNQQQIQRNNNNNNNQFETIESDQENRRLHQEQKIQQDYFSIPTAKNVVEQFKTQIKELESRYKVMVDQEIEKYRDNELIILKQELQKHFDEEIQLHKKRLDKIYDEGQKRLREKEKGVIETLKRRQAEFDHTANILKEKMMDQQQKSKQIEYEYKKHNCLDHEIVQVEKMRLKEMEKELRIKMDEYDNAKNTIQTNIEGEVQNRTRVLKKETEIQRENMLKSRFGKGMSKEDEEILKQHRENLGFLEQQRRYLSQQVEHFIVENKELKYQMDQQQKQLKIFQNQQETSQSSQKAYEERVQSFSEQHMKQIRQIEELQKKNQDLEQNLKQKSQELLALNNSYLIDLEKQLGGFKYEEVQLKKFYEEQKENQKMKILALTQERKQFEQKLMKKEELVTGYRKDIHDLQHQKNVLEENLKNIQIQQRKEQIAHEIFMGQQESHEQRINIVQQEIKEAKIKYIEDLQTNNQDKI